PTLKMRTGDFSEALLPQLLLSGQPAMDPLVRPVFGNAIYDPRTTKLAANGARIRDQFQGNVIPPELLDPVALKIQSMIPLPTNNNLVKNYVIPAYPNFRHTTIPSFKVDHNFDQKNHMSWYFQKTHTESPTANGFTQSFTSAIAQNDVNYTTRLN